MTKCRWCKDTIRLWGKHWCGERGALAGICDRMTESTSLQAAQIAAEGFLATRVAQYRLYEAQQISKSQALVSEMQSVRA